MYAHQEFYDGSGYPRGLKGEEIPLQARILAVADVYDALTSSRAYRNAWTHERAMETIKKEIKRVALRLSILLGYRPAKIDAATAATVF